MNPTATPPREFDLRHHGDEVIVRTDSDGRVFADVKIQQAKNEFRAIKFTFDTQTQLERLIGPILKALK